MKIITIRGSIAVGKSTFIQILTKHFNKTNKKFIVINEPAMNEHLKPILKKTIEGDDKNLNNSFQLLMLGIKLGQLKTTIDTFINGENIDYIILDRDFIEDKIFMELYGDNNDEVYFDVYSKIEPLYKYWQNKHNINIINIFLKTPLDVQVRNYAKRTNDTIDNVIDYITYVNKAYDSKENELINKNTIIVNNDGTGTFFEIDKEILEKL